MKCIYLNGELDASENVGPNRLKWGNSSIRIGEEYSGHFHGLMDDIRIYNRALSKSEINFLIKQKP